MTGTHGRRAAAPTGKRRSNASSSSFVRRQSTLVTLTGTPLSRRQMRVAQAQAVEAERLRVKKARQGVVKRRAVKTAATLTATGGLMLTFAMPSFAVSPVTAASTNLTTHKFDKAAQETEAASNTDTQSDADSAADTTAADASSSETQSLATTAPSAAASSSASTTTASTQDNKDAGTAALGEDRPEASAKAPAKTSTSIASEDGSVDAAALLSYGAKYFGVPYVWGGTTPSGFDCSGYTAWVFRKAGINLPHSSSAQGHMGTPVSAANAKPGDLLWIPGHVGIYAGNGRIMHAPHPGSHVKIQKMWGANWKYIRL